MKSMDQGALAGVRADYARRMLARAGAAGDWRLERAFAATPREAFLGPPPWLVSGDLEYADATADPARLYQDVLVALKPEKLINNGSPSLHAAWLHAAGVRSGERVCHIGAGAGYYTAILSRLCGAQGQVTAIEFEADLAAAARAHLAAYRNVSVITGDGADWPREACDVVYVNFAVDRPAPAWLERLPPGGRLLFPLGTIAPPGGRPYGIALIVTRVGADAFAARSLGGAVFVRAQGG
ncbi:MAG: methyltransferase domain-containing protein, partial [Pseudomonadota bacterium]|nr:methyltransferase domain-containing protein [Pseudomonadota bacterium]